MNYDEVLEQSLKVQWKVGVCPSGKKCWCRVIVPKKPLLYKDYEDSEPDEYWISRPGELDKMTVEHLVTIHNNALKETKLSWWESLLQFFKIR